MPSPSQTPTPTATPRPYPSDSPAATAALRQRLKDWLSGRLRVPYDKRWVQYGVLGRLTLTILPFEKLVRDQGPWMPSLHAFVLGTQVVNDRAGVAHLVVYLGQEDGRGNRYYFPVNVGRLDNDHKTSLGQVPSRDDIATAEEYPLLPNPKAVAIFRRLTGDTVLVSVAAYDYTASDVIAAFDPQESVAGHAVGVQLADFSLAASTRRYTDVLEKYPLVRGMLNREVKTLNPAAIIHGFAFKVPISGIWVPDPLPITVQGSDTTLPASFILAAGTYKTEYAVLGTCSLTLALDFPAKPFVYVAQAVPVTEQALTTGTVTVKWTGRYHVTPLTTAGCSWSLTLSKP